MPAPQRDNHAQRSSRVELEEQLLAELRLVEADFRNAPQDQKEAAGERYRTTLERFNAFILDGRIPPGCSGEP